MSTAPDLRVAASPGTPASTSSPGTDHAPANGSGRFCARGCGRSLDGYRKSRKYCGAPDCKATGHAPARVKKTDAPVVPLAGPDSYWSTELPASRGQLASIAHMACELLHINPPKTRLDASYATARLRLAIGNAPSPPPLGAGQARAAVEQVTPDDAEQLVDEEFKDADARRGGHDQTTGRTFQCPSCKKFVRNPAARCPHCGYDRDMGW